MSFKDRAKEVLAEGSAERGNYSPSANSLPLRMYQFWASVRPSKVPTRENFCHYWRVVAIWAPLWFLLTRFEKLVSSQTGAFTVAGGVIGVAIWLISLGGVPAWTGLLFALVILWVVAGLFVGTVAAASRNSYEPFIEEFGLRPFYFLPTAFLSYGLIAGIGNALNRIPRDRRKQIGDLLMRGILGLLVLGASALTLLFAITRTAEFFAVLGILVGLFVVGGIVVFVLSFVADFLKNRHRKAVAARTKYVEEDLGFGVKYTNKVVEPSRTAKFFMAIGDFLNLAFQVVRVKKWKICPIVEIPQR